MLDYDLFKKLLFKIDPEKGHRIAEIFLKATGTCPVCLERMGKLFVVSDERLRQKILGMDFSNPVGMAAGFDKNATMVRGLSSMGFGFVEVGTVTPRPQPGNPRPRLFRFPEEESIQNAMGFNNDGMEEVKGRLTMVRPSDVPVGVNIGKNKVTPPEKAAEDYLMLISAFKDICDYLVINISSPNTPGLRDLQNQAFIEGLLLSARNETTLPIFVKIAPDMDERDAVDLCRAAVQSGAAGIIANNTSIDYSLLKHPMQIGGISGRAIREKSFAMFEAIARELYGKAVLISVGGIDSGKEAYRRIRAGASLVQVYSALIFHGPSLVKNINMELLALMERDGVRSISEVTGADRRPQ